MKPGQIKPITPTAAAIGCGMCAHVNREQDAQGQFAGLSCRRYPPTIVMAQQRLPPAMALQTGQQVATVPVGMFPPVGESTKCGEFKPAFNESMNQ